MSSNGRLMAKDIYNLQELDIALLSSTFVQQKVAANLENMRSAYSYPPVNERISFSNWFFDGCSMNRVRNRTGNINI